jgi:hypothetical protein
LRCNGGTGVTQNCSKTARCFTKPITGENRGNKKRIPKLGGTLEKLKKVV